MEKYTCKLPIGVNFCHHHLNQEKKARSNDEANLTPTNAPPIEEEFTPDQPVFSEENKLNSSLEGEKLADALGISPIKFQNYHKNVEDLSTSTRRKSTGKLNGPR